MEKSKEIVKWKMRQELSVGMFGPLKLIENKVKSFCWQHGLDCQVLKSGLIVRNVTFLISGESTEDDAKAYSNALRNYFLDLERLW